MQNSNDENSVLFYVPQARALCLSRPGEGEAELKQRAKLLLARDVLTAQALEIMKACEDNDALTVPRICARIAGEAAHGAQTDQLQNAQDIAQLGFNLTVKIKAWEGIE